MQPKILVQMNSFSDINSIIKQESPGKASETPKWKYTIVTVSPNTSSCHTIDRELSPLHLYSRLTQRPAVSRIVL